MAYGELQAVRSSGPAGLSALQLVGDQPTFSILCELATGRLRPIELEQRLGLLGHTVVSRRLSRLVRAGALLRHSTASVPRQVSYELSKRGRRLAAMVLVAAIWEVRNERPGEATATIDLGLLLRVAAPLASPPRDISGSCAITVSEDGRPCRDFVLALDRGSIALLSDDLTRSTLDARARASALDWLEAIAEGRSRGVEIAGDQNIVHVALGAIHEGLFAHPFG